MDILDVVRTKSTSWAYVEIPANKTPHGLMRDEISPNQHYIVATLRKCRIPNLRVLFSNFYGTVHSYCELQTGTGEIGKFQTVTTPQQLQGADPDHLDRTIAMDIPLLGPVPFTGGNLVMQIGLFAMQESDLSAPYLNLLGTVANKAGISYFSTAVQLAQPILDGMNAIVNSTSGGLQIGLYKGFVEPDNPTQGYYAMVAAPMDQINVSNLAIDNAERLVYFDSRKEIDEAYLVFTLERLLERSDWKQIPTIKESYSSIYQAFGTDDSSRINNAMMAFRVSVGSCLELLGPQRDKIIGTVQEEVNKFIGLVGQGGHPKPTNLTDLV
jgi:hypothetical protein